MNIQTGKDLKTWREKNHLTMSELANRIGYSKDRIAHIEIEHDKKLSKRLVHKLEDVDHELNSPFAEKINTLRTYANYNHLVDSILKNLNILLDSENVNDEEISNYLNFLNSTLMQLMEIKKIPSTNTDICYTELRRFSQSILKSSQEYLTNLHVNIIDDRKK